MGPESSLANGRLASIGFWIAGIVAVAAAMLLALGVVGTRRHRARVRRYHEQISWMIDNPVWPSPPTPAATAPPNPEPSAPPSSSPPPG